jgi:hypothetical protein
MLDEEDGKDADGGRRVDGGESSGGEEDGRVGGFVMRSMVSLRDGRRCASRNGMLPSSLWRLVRELGLDASMSLLIVELVFIVSWITKSFPEFVGVCELGSRYCVVRRLCVLVVAEDCVKMGGWRLVGYATPAAAA